MLVLVFISHNCSSQNIKDDLMAINNDMLQNKTYSINIITNVYLDDKMNAAFQSRPMILLKQNNKLHVYEGSEIEIINDTKLQAIINHKSKTIILSDLSIANPDSISEFKTNYLKFIDADLDSINNLHKEIKFEKLSNKSVKYELIGNGLNPVKIAWVMIDVENKMYSSIRSLFAKKELVPELDNKEHYLAVERLFKGYNKNPVFNSETFNLNKFIRQDSNGSFTLTEKYKKYELIN